MAVKSIILIDLENVQPQSLEALKGHPFQVFVFVGANQNKIGFNLAASMQSLGAESNYIKISGTGPNALDFHIAYYIGEISQKTPQAKFYIISKDTGFDPLIAHLKTKHIRVYRKKNIAEIPELQISNSTPEEEKLTAVVKNLIHRKQSRPRKIKTLTNTINSLFAGGLDENQLKSIIKHLQNKKYITVKDESVTYTLPNSPN